MSDNSKFVKNLASTDPDTRDKALESLAKYLKSNGVKLSLLELEKLWKGLYYSMWFSDGAENQQDLAEQLGKLFVDGVTDRAFCKFLEAFWVVITKMWPEIDQWRIDKYYLLIRRVLRNNLRYLQKHKWDAKHIQRFNEVMAKGPLSGDKAVPMALPYHLCDIYVDEMELVEVSEDAVAQLIEPFAALNKSALLKTLREKCKEDVLDDERVKRWLGDDSDAEEESEEEDEEWKGF